METKKLDLMHVILIVIVAICLTSIGYNIFRPPNTITKTEWTKPPEPKEIRTIEKILVPGPTQVITIDKPVIVERLKLPETFKNNTSLQAISSADLEPTKSGYTVIGTLNTSTGEGGLIAKEKERSLAGLPSNLSVGARYGPTFDGQQAVVYGKYQPLRIGNAYIGLYGEGNTGRRLRPDGKVMIELEYKIKSD